MLLDRMYIVEMPTRCILTYRRRNVGWAYNANCWAATSCLVAFRKIQETKDFRFTVACLLPVLVCLLVSDLSLVSFPKS